MGWTQFIWTDRKYVQSFVEKPLVQSRCKLREDCSTSCHGLFIQKQSHSICLYLSEGKSLIPV